MDVDLVQRLSDLYARNADLDQRQRDHFDRACACIANRKNVAAEVFVELEREAEQLQEEREKLTQESDALAAEARKMLQDVEATEKP